MMKKILRAMGILIAIPLLSSCFLLNSLVTPSAPTHLHATVGDGQILLDWSAVSGATSYNVYYKQGSTVTLSDYGTKSPAVDGATYTVKNLVNGSAYAFVVTASNANGESPASAAVAATPTVAAAVLPKLGVCIYASDDTYMQYVRDEIITDAAAKLDLSIVYGNRDQTVQDGQIDQLIAAGVEGLALNLVDPAQAGQAIAKAKLADIPVVVFNRQPLASDLATYSKAYFVGCRAPQAGIFQGEMIADYWKAHPEADLNHDGTMQYVLIEGDMNHPEAQARTQYSIETVTGAGISLEKVAEDTAMWDRLQAKALMTSWLAAYTNIEAVIANNDDMAIGAIEALGDAGYFRTGGKYLPVVGVDATPFALQAIGDGTLLGTVLNDAIGQGKATLDLAYSLITGTSAYTDVAPMANSDGSANASGKYVWVPYRKVTADNYTEYQ
jgi:methyl-galactoside transport system substrate-binding protein